MEIPRFGERVYKQIITNGNKVNKWVCLARIEKYDENGNLIYDNDNGHEVWKEYDSHNNAISEKHNNGEEKTWKRKYDSNGNCIWFRRDWSGYESYRDFDEQNNLIHTKDSDGKETWYNYDSNNNLIHTKDSQMNEWWGKYDENGFLIHTRTGLENWITSWVETRIDNDSKGNVIHTKGHNGQESYFEYDENDNLIHRINPDGSEFWFEIECYENGKPKLVLSFGRI